MEGEQKVKLYGNWASGYVKRVQIALKIKGIPYEYIEEDLRDKSEEFLHYNPVLKKVPTLVHNGKPIVESLIILEYIDENWTNLHRILPTDPYERAKVRFWAKFIDDQLLKSIGLVGSKEEGEEKEKEESKREMVKTMKVLEEGIAEFFPDGVSPSFDGKSSIYLIIALNGILSFYRTAEKVWGFKIIDPEKNPLLFRWVTSFNELPEFKELFPPLDKLEVHLQRYVPKRTST